MRDGDVVTHVILGFMKPFKWRVLIISDSLEDQSVVTITIQIHYVWSASALIKFHASVAVLQ